MNFYPFVVTVSFILFITITKSFGAEYFVISEIDSYSAVDPGEKEFIEIATFSQLHSGPVLPSANSPLQNIYIIGIAIRDNKNYVELVANLWNERTTENGYFVIGGDKVKEANMKPNSNMLKYRKKLQPGIRHGGLMAFFAQRSEGRHTPSAVVLLAEPRARGSSRLNDLVWKPFTAERPFLKLDAELTENLKPFIVDMVIFSGSGGVDYCPIFEQLNSKFHSTSNYLVREFEGSSSSAGLSINRCTMETTAFIPQAFKLGTPTPGAENDCSGVRFILQEYITSPTFEASAPVDIPHSEPMELGSCASSSGFSLHEEMYSGAMLTEYLQSTISEEARDSVCRADESGILGTEGDITHDLEITEERIHNFDRSVIRSNFEWNTEANFDPDWEQFISTHLSMLLPLESILRNKDWFTLIPDHSNPSNSKYRCRLCHRYYDKFRLQWKYKNNLAMDDGFMASTYRKNQEVIREHRGIAGHLHIIKIIQQRAQDEVPQALADMQKRLEQEEAGIMKATAKMMRTVYAEAISNIPFIAHSTMVQLQAMNGADLGTHHRHKSYSVKITASISTEMHRSLLQHLTSSNSPVSIILDGSTDFKYRHYLIVYLQGIENFEPRCYFYRLIELHLETAEGHFNSLINAIQAEPFEFRNYLQNSLVGFASDGATVMIGQHTGLRTRIRQWIGRPYFTIHCMAHRLHLAITYATRAVPFYEKLNDLLRSTYNFYNEHGHKQKAHLRELAEALHMKLYELRTVYPIRWIESEDRALQALDKNWKLIVQDLEAISTDTDFSDEVRAKATGLYRKLRNRKFNIILKFSLDVTNELTFWSKKLQERAGTVIGLEQLRKNMLAHITTLKEKDGQALDLYRKEVICSDRTRAGKCTLDQYYASQSVRRQQVELSDEDFRDAPDLNELRRVLIDALVSELTRYFPDDSLEHFKIFDPKQWPREEGQLGHYGTTEIQTIVSELTPSLDQAVLKVQWRNIIQAIQSDPEFCKYSKSRVTTFWQHYLSKNNLLDEDTGRTITWPPELQHLLKVVLVLPIGSADAERGFSTMNDIKSSRRLLSPENLDHLMRIRLNGPKDLSKFPAKKYAEKWVKAGHIRTDDPTGVRAVAVVGDEPVDDTIFENRNVQDNEYFTESNLF